MTPTRANGASWLDPRFGYRAHAAAEMEGAKDSHLLAHCNPDVDGIPTAHNGDRRPFGSGRFCLCGGLVVAASNLAGYCCGRVTAPSLHDDELHDKCRAARNQGDDDQGQGKLDGDHSPLLSAALLMSTWMLADRRDDRLA